MMRRLNECVAANGQHFEHLMWYSKGYQHMNVSRSRNLFIFGPMLIGTFLLILGWGIPRKSLWH